MKLDTTAPITTNSYNDGRVPVAVSGRGWIAVGALLADAAVTGGLFLGRLRETAMIRDLAAGRVVSDAEIESSDSLVETLTGLHTPVFVAAAFFFLVWIYSANKRAHGLAPTGMRFSPWASVLWFFAPLANLVIPLRAIREIWRVSDPNVDRAVPLAWQHAPTTWLLGVWWVAWIGTNVFSRLQPTRLTGNESVERLVQISAAAGWISAGIAVSALLACGVVIFIESRLRLSEDRMAVAPAASL